MEHLALYRKWRPQTFGDLVGQEHISRTLLNAIRLDRLAHAYLFCGPRGTGKTSTARLLAKSLNCANPSEGEPCNQCVSCQEITAGHSLDVIEIDAASNRGIDDARELREQVRFSASGGHYRIFIIDEFHMLTNEAFNALLKTLEEPPANVIFVLATTEPHKVLQTIVSRCQRFDFQRIALPALIQHLHKVAQAEQIGISAQAIEAIGRKAAGGGRDALSLLDQVHAMSSPGETLPDALVYQVLGLIEEDILLQLVQALFHGQLETLLQTLQILLEKGHDTLQIVQELLQVLRHLTLSELPQARMEELGVPSHLVTPLKELRKPLAQGQTITVIEQLVKTADRLHKVTQPEIWLEADLIQICLQGESSLLQRLESLEQKLINGLPVSQEAVPSPKAAPSPPAPARPQETPPARPLPSPSLPLPSAPPPLGKPAPLPPPKPFQAPEPPQAAAYSEPEEDLPEDFEPEMPPFEDEPYLPEEPDREVEPVYAAGTVVPDQDMRQIWQRFLSAVLDQQGPLYGFMKNGKLMHIDPSRRQWIVRFNSKPHKERVEKSLKAGRLTPLLEEIMGEAYQLILELSGESPEAEATGLPATAQYKAPPEGNLPPPPPRRETPSESSERVSPPQPTLQRAPLPAPTAEVLQTPAEAKPAPVALAPAPSAAPPVPAETRPAEPQRKPRSPEEVSFARTQPLEAVAELFKGKVIRRDH